jgi:molybdopterin converting factor small subunit
MAVTVRFFANFREAVGKGKETVEGVKDIASLLDKLAQKFERLAEQLYFPGTRKLRPTVFILVNGKGIGAPPKLDTRL